MAADEPASIRVERASRATGVPIAGDNEELAFNGPALSDSDHAVRALPTMWARLGSNQRPPACKFDPLCPGRSTRVRDLRPMSIDGLRRPGSSDPVAVTVAVDSHRVPTALVHRRRAYSILTACRRPGRPWRRVLAPVQKERSNGRTTWHGARLCLGSLSGSTADGPPLQGRTTEALGGGVQAGRQDSPTRNLRTWVTSASVRPLWSGRDPK